MTDAANFPYATHLDIKFPALATADVPKGVVHRTRAPQRAVILMVETASITPTGDT